MIDSVDVFDAKRGHIETTSNVPAKSPVFEGHFPSYPILPGVLILETMNHAAGWLMLGLNRWSRLPFFVGAKRVKIRHFVTPGQVMKATADLLHDGSGFAVSQCEVTVGGNQIAEAEVTMMLMNFPTPELGAEVERRRPHGRHGRRGRRLTMTATR